MKKNFFKKIHSVTKKTTCLLGLLLCCFFSVSPLTAGDYQNPIIPGYAPDPSICRKGDDYYLANSSFEFFPGVPIYHSKDLVNWKLIGYCLTRKQNFDISTIKSYAGVWAPTLRYHGGKFHMIVKVQGYRKMIYTSATNPAGPWEVPTIIKKTNGAEWKDGIDPDLFFDTDGKVYSTKPIEVGPDGNTETHFECAEINLNTGTVSNIRYLWKGAGFGSEEGPHIYRLNGYYYLLLAEGGTWNQHKVTIARRPVNKGLDGPNGWEPHPNNPIVFNDPGVPQEINVTGHGDLIQDHTGNWWIVFLAKRLNPQPDLARETYLAPVTWNNQDWPIVNNNEFIKINMSGPTLPEVPQVLEPPYDDFETDQLALHWNFLRIPNNNNWSLTEKPGFLTLNGTANKLNEQKTSAWIARRLRDKTFTATTEIDFTPTKNTEVAGMTLYNSTTRHCEFVLTKRGGEKRVMVRITSSNIAAEAAVGDGPVLLEISCKNEKYIFKYTESGGTKTTLYQAGCTSIIDKPHFSGIYVGMYASGNGSNNTYPAHYSWFEYKSDNTQVLEDTIRVNAGGNFYTDNSGNTWSSDYGSNGGKTYQTSDPIGNTNNDILFQTERWHNANFTYSFAMPNKTYDVNLYFAEIYFTAPGQRVMDIAIEGQNKLTNFDIYADSGHDHMVKKSFTVDLNDQNMQITLKKVIQNPKISAIEIVPAGADDDDDDDNNNDNDNNDDNNDNNDDNHPANAVQLWVNADYKGTKANFTVGAYNQAAMVAAGMNNNDAHSIKVLPNYKATVFTGSNFDGSSKPFTADAPRLGGQFSNQVSSLIVEYLGDDDDDDNDNDDNDDDNDNDDNDDDNDDDDFAANAVRLWSDPDYKGTKVLFTVGDYNQAAMVAAGMKNNDVHSIKVLPGYEATVFTGGNFDGSSKVFTLDAPRLGGSFSNQVSSLRVRYIGN